MDIAHIKYAVGVEEVVVSLTARALHFQDFCPDGDIYLEKQGKQILLQCLERVIGMSLAWGSAVKT